MDKDDILRDDIVHKGQVFICDDNTEAIAEERLCISGMGEVWYASYQGNRVILKVPFFSTDSNFMPSNYIKYEIAYFESCNDNPNIVKYLNKGLFDFKYKSITKQPFILIDYVSGKTLNQFINEHGPLSTDKVKNLFPKIIDIIKYIHSNGFIYRDLQSENLILRNDSIDDPCLFDFGLCLPVDVSRKKSKSMYVVGSPHYIPPERINGSEELEPSDAYSLGHLLYFAATGKYLFNGTDTEILERHRLKDRFFFKQYWEGVDPELKKITLNLINWDPAKRISLDELKKCLN